MENEMKWYVIRCYSGKEKKAKKHIDSEFLKQNLYEKDVKRIIIPIRKEVYVKNGKKINREVNYYPGYVLIETNMSSEVQHIINNAQGVMNILGTKDKPEPLKEEEVKRILGKIDNFEDEGTTTKSNLIIGENVIITDGPFSNFNAVVEEINDDKKKLKVAIKIFGRRTPVDIDFSQATRT